MSAAALTSENTNFEDWPTGSGPIVKAASVEAWSTHTSDDEVAKYLTNEIKGKVVLVTGVTQGGIGADFARAITEHSNPALVILAGRQHAKGVETQEVLKKVNPSVETRILDIDLGDMASVRKAAEEVNNYKENIDVLVNNAAVMAAPWAKTVDGIESQWGIGHIGHFLFTNLIMGKLLANEKCRIVNVSSRGHRMGGVRFDDYNFQDGAVYEKWTAYGQAKTSNILFSLALADRLGSRGVSAFSLHPGGIATNLGRHMSEQEKEAISSLVPDMKTVPEGASTTTVAAFDPAIESHNGGYLQDCHVRDVESNAKSWATGLDNANKLWELSEKVVGQKFEY